MSEEDPDYILWLEDRHAEAVKDMEAQMEAEREQRRDYWLKITEGEDPC